jgi:hypothetical protein
MSSPALKRRQDLSPAAAQREGCGVESRRSCTRSRIYIIYYYCFLAASLVSSQLRFLPERPSDSIIGTHNGQSECAS